MNTVDHGMPKAGKKFNPDIHIPDWKGPNRPYDILKEVAIATIVVVIGVLLLAALFSSPDDPPITIQQWATKDPVDFVQTAIAELDGSSHVAQYGPPYNSTTGSSQSLGPISPEQWLGVTIPINTAHDFVLAPLATIPGDSTLATALNKYSSASSSQQTSWTSAFEKIAPNIQASGATGITIPTGDYGPVKVLMSRLLSMAQSGALDGALISNKQFYTTNYTNVLLFLSDGGYFPGVAHSRHLLGTEWGMMNETGSYPGQAWLWLYTMLYQVQPYASSSSADFWVWGTMMILTVLFIFVPFIPGLRSIPRWTKVYRVIWKSHYSHTPKE